MMFHCLSQQLRKFCQFPIYPGRDGTDKTNVNPTQPNPNQLSEQMPLPPVADDFPQKDKIHPKFINFSGSRPSHGYRGKRSTVDTNALEFAAIAQIEPEQCYRRLICDLATGQMPPSDNDIILSLFEDAAALDVTSPVFEFAVAAELGRHVKDISVCELRYSCSVTGNDLLEATA